MSEVAVHPPACSAEGCCGVPVHKMTGVEVDGVSINIYFCEDCQEKRKANAKKMAEANEDIVVGEGLA
jgi:hypothetical protein